MGLNLLDIRYRVEREFGVDPTGERLRQLLLQHRPPDITAGEFYVHIGNLCRSKWLPVPADSWPRFQQILSEVTGVEVSEIQTDSWLGQDLGVDR